MRFKRARFIPSVGVSCLTLLSVAFLGLSATPANAVGVGGPPSTPKPAQHDPLMILSIRSSGQLTVVPTAPENCTEDETTINQKYEFDRAVTLSFSAKGGAFSRCGYERSYQSWKVTLSGTGIVGHIWLGQESYLGEYKASCGNAGQPWPANVHCDVGGWGRQKFPFILLQRT